MVVFLQAGRFWPPVPPVAGGVFPIYSGIPKNDSSVTDARFRVPVLSGCQVAGMLI